jgi:hypothetical protein
MADEIHTELSTWQSQGCPEILAYPALPNQVWTAKDGSARLVLGVWTDLAPTRVHWQTPGSSASHVCSLMDFAEWAWLEKAEPGPREA